MVLPAPSPYHRPWSSKYDIDVFNYSNVSVKSPIITASQLWPRTTWTNACVNTATSEVITGHDFLVQEMASSEHRRLETGNDTFLRRTSTVYGNRLLLLWLPTMVLLTVGQSSAVWRRSPAANGLLPWQDLVEPISMQELLVAKCRTHKLCAHDRSTKFNHNTICGYYYYYYLIRIKKCT